MNCDDDETIVDSLLRARDPQPAKQEPLADTRPLSIAERFDVVRPLGEGGMGQVFLVRDRQIEGREVALKVLRKRYSKNADFKRMFFREIKTAQQFVSPHVNQVRDTGQLPDGSLFLTMDYVDGESLQARLAREHVLLPRHALEIARQVLLGLASGHEKGCVHRDVKPGNIMLQRQVAKTDENPYGVDVRLLDFGIAGVAAELFEEGVSGTPAYMSPEQAKGQLLDPRSDLFAVGLILFEMIAGERLFHGKTLREIETSLLDVRIETRVAELTTVKQPVKRIIARALQKDREKRYQSAADFAAAIEKSKAYKLPTNVPVWAWCAMGAIALLPLAGTTVFGGDNGLQRVIAEKEAVIRGTTGTVQAMQMERDKAQERSLEMENQRARAVEAKSVAEDDLARAKETASNREIEHNQVVATLNSTIELNKTTIASMGRRLSDTETTLNSAKDEIAQLKLERSREKPQYIRAQTFDRIVDLEVQGNAVDAYKTFKEKKGNAFSGEGLEGADFVEALVQSAAEFQQFERSRSGQADVRAYFSAKRARDEALKLRPGFPSVAAGWIALEEPSSGSRIFAVDQILANLSDRIDASKSELDKAHADDWQRLRALGALQDPSKVQAHALSYDCGHVGEFARAAIEETQLRSVENGHLKREVLVVLDTLAQWTKVVQAAEPELAQLRPRFAVFDYARRFYDADESNDTLGPAFDPKCVGSDDGGWAGKLLLAGRILQRTSGYPIRTGDTLIFRVASNSAEPTFWQEKPATIAPETTGDEWKFTRAIFSESGSVLQELTPFSIVRRGKAWYLGTATTPILDLGDQEDSFRVEQVEDVELSALPVQLGIGELDQQVFRTAWKQSDRTCLIWKRGDSECWISPTWGLVRQVDKTPTGAVRRDLVYSNRSAR